MLAIVLLLVSSSMAIMPAPCPGCTVVFYQAYNGSKCYRIPTIIQTRAGTLLAFSERRTSGCSDNGGDHDLVLRRSTDDGKTWGPEILAVKGHGPYSNPNPVEVTVRDGSRAILMHYDTLNNPQSTHHGYDMQIWSHDDGRTWESPSKIEYPPQPNMGALIGPSVGIQSSNGTIYFSAVFAGHHWLYWSHDSGTSWQSSRTIEGLGECSIAFLRSAADGHIIMNCRTDKKHRAQVMWSPAGVPGNVTYPQGLVDANCQGSIVNMAGVLYTSNAADVSSRSHMTVKSSTDEGKTWSKGDVVWDGPAAYSQLVAMEGGKLGLLFEAGKTSAYETISFVVVSI